MQTKVRRKWAMKIITHPDFLKPYTRDPAAAPGRLEPILEELKKDGYEFIEPLPAGWDDIERVHSNDHIEHVTRHGLYAISALAAGGAIQAAEIGMKEPAFAIIRPPGHHASSDSSWGFCFFNNMAIAIEYLKYSGKIQSAHILDFDLHYGDGTVNILGSKGYVTIHNPDASTREAYLALVRTQLWKVTPDVIAVSAGFDNHIQDWGGLLTTEDYYEMGKMVFLRAKELGAGTFAVLEGGYNHDVLGLNARAFAQGLCGKDLNLS